MQTFKEFLNENQSQNTDLNESISKDEIAVNKDRVGKTRLDKDGNELQSVESTVVEVGSDYIVTVSDVGSGLFSLATEHLNKNKSQIVVFDKKSIKPIIDALNKLK